MPTPMDLAEAYGPQLEHVRPKLQTMFQTDAGLFGEIEDKTESAEGVSMRQSRIPLSLAQFGYFQQFNPDGGDMGVGNGGVTDALTLVPVFLEQALSWTALTEWATDTSKKSVENIVNEILDKGMAQFKSNLDALLAASAGDGSLDTVVSSGTGTVTVNNANLFQDQGIYQVVSSGGVNRGNITVAYSDANQNVLNLNGAAPAGITAGDKLYIAGSSTVAQSSLNGIQNLQLNSNTGTYIGLNRATYPGRLSTPTFTVSGSLTQLVVRRLLNDIDTALGLDYTKDHKVVFHGNLDQAAAWELVGVAVSQVIQNQLKGSSSQDMLAKEMPMTAAGRQFFKNIHAVPGRLDALVLDSWGKVVNKKIDYYSVGGMTMFPAYGGSGGVAAQTLTYLVCGMQIYNANPRAGSYVSGLSKPYALGA